MMDLQRIDAYCKNILEYHTILDILPNICKLFFSKKFNLTMSTIQCSILLMLGLQHFNIDEINSVVNVEVSQILALFNKAIRKFRSVTKQILEQPTHKINKEKLQSVIEEMVQIQDGLEDQIEEEGKK